MMVGNRHHFIFAALMLCAASSLAAPRRHRVASPPSIQRPDGFSYRVLSVVEFQRSSETHACVVGTARPMGSTERDGDRHFRVEDGESFMVAEVVPWHPVGVPKRGMRVLVCGIRRFDGRHKWAELHPVEWWAEAVGSVGR